MSESTLDGRVVEFVSRLEKLDRGDLARLKRSAGQNLSEARQGALGLFYSLVPYNVPDWQHEMYFLVATLFPLADGGGNGGLGASLHRCRSERFSKGLDQRMSVLLDADSNQLAYRLRQAVHFIRSNRVRINWPLLLNDLLYWTAPGRNVQRRWAQDYFAEVPRPTAAKKPA